ncbi:MAG: T9SS type A sorting domain-containing protein [Chitinophagales bacterium]|nr:T9SS type A sorting domain-containing protein [Chitinophagales bacterium]
MKYIIILYIFLISILPRLDAQIFLDSTVLDSTVLIDNLDIPWEVIYGPDDMLWVTERFGRVSRISPNTGAQNIVLDISAQVTDVGESGLLGLALHPDFTNNPQVFLVYTYKTGGEFFERLVKYTYNGSQLQNPQILLDSIAGNNIHDGSRIIITADSKLLFTTGDADDQSTPQNLQSLNGKTIRLNLDGSIPSDNPLTGNPIWTWGHRNAQGLAKHPSGKIFISEHGTSIDDEFNVIKGGSNYGWPFVEGNCDLPAEIQFCQDSAVVEPLMTWTPSIAPSDIVWYGDTEIPEWESSFLMVVLKEKKVVRLKLDNTQSNVTDTATYFEDYFGRLRDICVDPDGNIYLATNGSSWINSDPFSHKIIKISKSQATVIIEPEDKFLNVSFRDRTLTLLTDRSQIGKNYRIFDIDGKEVLRGELVDRKSIVPFDRSKGLYIIKIENVLTQKFIVH